MSDTPVEPVVVPTPASTSVHKAYAGGLTSGVVAFLSTLQIAAVDNGISLQEWITIALATVIGLAAGFGVTYSIPNKVLG
jgi:hypothetical protein